MLQLITFSHFANLMASNALARATLATIVLVLASRTHTASFPLAPHWLIVWRSAGGSDGSWGACCGARLRGSSCIDWQQQLLVPLLLLLLLLMLLMLMVSLLLLSVLLLLLNRDCLMLLVLVVVILALIVHRGDKICPEVQLMVGLQQDCLGLLLVLALAN